MTKIYDKPIIIQRINETSEQWEDLYRLHACVNMRSSDGEYSTAGAIRSKRSLTFEVRYFSALKDLSLNTSMFRIVYDGNSYNLIGYDDYMEQHKTVRLYGDFY